MIKIRGMVGHCFLVSRSKSHIGVSPCPVLSKSGRIASFHRAHSVSGSSRQDEGKGVQPPPVPADGPKCMWQLEITSEHGDRRCKEGGR